MGPEELGPAPFPAYSYTEDLEGSSQEEQASVRKNTCPMVIAIIQQMLGWLITNVTHKHLLAAAHLATLMAAPSPFPARQNCQQLCLVPHFFSQSQRAGRHLESLVQAVYSLGHFSLMQSVGSVMMATDILDTSTSNSTASMGTSWTSTSWLGALLRQPLAAAHLATLIAFWLPFLAKHNCQQLCLVPHWLSQDWRAGKHLESSEHALNSLGHFSLMQSVGSAGNIETLTSSLREGRAKAAEKSPRTMVAVFIRYYYQGINNHALITPKTHDP